MLSCESTIPDGLLQVMRQKRGFDVLPPRLCEKVRNLGRRTPVVYTWIAAEFGDFKKNHLTEILSKLSEIFGTKITKELELSLTESLLFTLNNYVSRIIISRGKQNEVPPIVNGEMRQIMIVLMHDFIRILEIGKQKGFSLEQTLMVAKRAYTVRPASFLQIIEAYPIIPPYDLANAIACQNNPTVLLNTWMDTFNKFRKIDKYKIFDDAALIRIIIRNPKDPIPDLEKRHKKESQILCRGVNDHYDDLVVFWGLLKEAMGIDPKIRQKARVHISVEAQAAIEAILKNKETNDPRLFRLADVVSIAVANLC